MKDYGIRRYAEPGITSSEVNAEPLEAWMTATDERLDNLEKAVSALRKSVSDLTAVSQDIVNAILKVNSTCSDFAHALSDTRDDVDNLKGGKS